ncbi:MAG: hypothetical protein R3E82_19145 [Pseudomonadales bacterium]|nr:hypothetical protein [Pseudomonadales bacterium]
MTSADVAEGSFSAPGASRFGFGWGIGSGVVLALVALLVAAPADPDDASRALLGSWLTTNLGHSIWLFGVVFTLYMMNLHQLRRILTGSPALREVVELDQLLDVWIHLFVGIGVIWTAVGMRSALQAALGEPGQAVVDSAGSVLQKLVDGGILLALTTTIIGGIGGYLMRLGKAMTVGANLIGYYADHQQSDMRTLITMVTRIENALNGARSHEVRSSNTQKSGDHHTNPQEALLS